MKLNQVGLAHRGVRPSDQQALGFPLGEQPRGMVNPALAAGDDDDRVGLWRVVGRRPAQGYREQREAQRVEYDEKRQQPGDHGRSRNALSSAALATTVAREATTNGSRPSSSASPQPSGGAPASMVAVPAPPRIKAMISP